MLKVEKLMIRVVTDTFNEQFLSVFTTHIPVSGNVYIEDQNDRLVEVKITVEAVKMRLTALREDNSPVSE